MNGLVAVIGVVIFVELLLYLPVGTQARRLARVGSRAQQVLRSSRISDHWKEKVLLRYAQDLLRASLYLTALILSAALPLLAMAALLQWAEVSAALTWLSSSTGLLVCTLVGTAWAVVRRKLASSSLERETALSEKQP